MKNVGALTGIYGALLDKFFWQYMQLTSDFSNLKFNTVLCIETDLSGMILFAVIGGLFSMTTCACM